MTTATAVLVTQVPIAIGCFWAAYELSRLRLSIERYLDPKSAPETRADSAPRPR